MVFEVRGRQVMIDLDFAKLYELKTKRINGVLKRNFEKFLERYTFILNGDEIEKLQNIFFYILYF